MTTKPEVKLPDFPEPWIIVNEVAIPVEGHRPQLGYTFNWHTELYSSFEAASAAIAEKELPLGWVCGKLSQFFPIAASMREYGTLCYEAGLSQAKALETLLAAAQNEARAAEESLREVVRQREDLRAELAAVRGRAEPDWRAFCEGLVDIYSEIGMPVEDRCYVDSALPDLVSEVDSALKQSLAQPAQAVVPEASYMERKKQLIKTGVCRAENAANLCSECIMKTTSGLKTWRCQAALNAAPDSAEGS